MLYWLLKRLVLGPLVLTVYRPWVEGREHVPDHGPALLASNHLSFSDSIFLPLVLDRRVTFLAKEEYFTGRGLRGRLTAVFFRAAGQLPVDRSGGAAGLASLRSGLPVLRRGELLGIYPEGTRSPDGRLHRGRTGAARLALESGAPVVPVAMVGTDVVQPVGRRIPAVRRVGVRFGPPVDLSRYAGGADDRFVLRAATDDVMRAVLALSDQEYVDVYATVTKEALARQREAAEHGRVVDLPAGAPAPGGVRPDPRAPGRADEDDDAVPGDLSRGHEGRPEGGHGHERGQDHERGHDRRRGGDVRGTGRRGR